MHGPSCWQHGPVCGSMGRLSLRGCMDRLLSGCMVSGRLEQSSAAAWAVFLCGSMDRLPGRMGPFVCGNMGRLHYAVAWTAYWPPGKLSDCMGRLSLCGSMDRLLSLSAVAWTVRHLLHVGICRQVYGCIDRLPGSIGLLCGCIGRLIVRSHRPSSWLHRPIVRGCLGRLYCAVA